MVGIVPEASACQAFGAVAASERAMAAAGTFACRACSSFAVLADRQNLDRSGPIPAAVWQLAPGPDGFSLSDHRHPGRYEKGVRLFPELRHLPGHRPSAAVAEPSRNLPGDPKRVTVRNIDSFFVLVIGSEAGIGDFSRPNRCRFFRFCVGHCGREQTVYDLAEKHDSSLDLNEKTERK